MEATAEFDFQATAEDELSFVQGQQIKILQTERDANWYNAVLYRQVGFVPKNYIKMSKVSWYYGKISRAKAEELLADQPYNGAFLIRDSETIMEPGSYSLSVKFEGQVQHFKILKDCDFKFYIWMTKFESLNKLVDHHRDTSISRVCKIMLRDMVPTEAPRKQQQTVFAMFDFQPDEQGELGFRKGEEIELLDCTHAEWWKGQLNGQIGYFPKNYVRQNPVRFS